MKKYFAFNENKTRTNKDKLFLLIVALWIGTNTAGYFLDYDIGVLVSNLVWFCIIDFIIFKKNNDQRFNSWLNRKI
jgi:hypothetical protein